MDWHYVSNGNNVGPVSLEQLQAAVQTGQVRADTLVWNAGLPKWIPAHSLPDLGLAAPAGHAVLAYDAPELGQAIVTDHAFRLIAQAKPWVRFLSVICYVFAGLTLFGGLMAIAMVGGRGLPSWMGLMYVLFAVLYLIPAVLLGRYASRLATLLGMRRSDHLEAALDAQRALFRTLGIMVITLIVLYFVSVVVVILVNRR